MSVLVNKDSKIVVQGFTGSEGTFHAGQMIEYGTNVVGGVTPGKGGQTHLDRPVFNTVADAVAKAGANVSIIFVPPAFAADAIMEAADAGIKVIVAVTEGIPTKDMVIAKEYIKTKDVILVGPNCPGLLTPGETKVGIIPGDISMPGNVGVVSRSGTLTYEVLYALKLVGMGATTCVGIGGDPINGTSFIDALGMFEADPHTEKIVMIGEIGGTDEERAAEYIADHLTKPVAAFIAGQSAPPGKRMGHAGAIVEGGSGTAAEKIKALKEVGVRVAAHPEEIPSLLG